MHHTLLTRICVALAAVAAVSLLAGPLAAAAPAGPAVVPSIPGPEQADHGAATGYVKAHPDSVPAGTNNFACRTDKAHPRPVVLAHGTDSTVYSDWAGIAPKLTRAGYCVFAPSYGGKPGANTFGTEDIVPSGEQFKAFVERVLAATRAKQVDIMGYSQGATVSRYYINRLGGAPKVANWIGLASPSYGSVLYGVVPVVQAIPGLIEAAGPLVTTPAALQQVQGAPFLAALNAGGDTVGGVRYTTIASRVDEMIQPYTNVALRSPGARNLVIQDLCPADMSGHFNLVYDRFAQQLAINALGGPGYAPPPCEAVPLGTGIPSVIIATH
jgi:triacylglycerol esterase/lipase EstA (alpha/beta hydrolase family)